MASNKTATTKRERSDVGFDVDEFLASTATQGTNLDSIILGIDEAGRGPAFGDMVYCGAYIPLRDHAKLIEAGAMDSKMLTEASRETCRTKLENIPTLVAIERPLSPQYIADTMYSRGGRNLNTISHETAVEIIREATLRAGGKLCGVYIDTVGPPESYQRMLQGRFPHLNITVAKKADSTYPIVSAASIFAKTTRDRSIAELSAKHGHLGSGYPADPYTVKFMKQHVHRVFGFPPEYGFVRHSWGPIASIARTACIPMSWAHEEEKDGQPTASATKNMRRLDQMHTHRRDMVFSSPGMLGLSVSTDSLASLS